MAEQAIALRDQKQAVLHYKGALKVLPDDPNVMIALARLHLQGNEIDECQKICAEILKRDETHEGASVMMADLSFIQVKSLNGVHYLLLILIALSISRWTLKVLGFTFLNFCSPNQHTGRHWPVSLKL